MSLFLSLFENDRHFLSSWEKGFSVSVLENRDTARKLLIFKACKNVTSVKTHCNTHKTTLFPYHLVLKDAFKKKMPQKIYLSSYGTVAGAFSCTKNAG